MKNEWPGWERLVEFRMRNWDLHWGWTWWLSMAIGLDLVGLKDDVLRTIRLVGFPGSIAGEAIDVTA